MPATEADTTTVPQRHGIFMPARGTFVEAGRDRDVSRMPDPDIRFGIGLWPSEAMAWLEADDAFTDAAVRLRQLGPKLVAALQQMQTPLEGLEEPHRRRNRGRVDARTRRADADARRPRRALHRRAARPRRHHRSALLRRRRRTVASSQRQSARTGNRRTVGAGSGPGRTRRSRRRPARMGRDAGRIHDRREARLLRSASGQRPPTSTSSPIIPTSSAPTPTRSWRRSRPPPIRPSPPPKPSTPRCSACAAGSTCCSII